MFNKKFHKSKFLRLNSLLMERHWRAYGL